MTDLQKIASKLSEYKEIDIPTLDNLCQNMVKSVCHVAIMNQPYLDNIIKGEKTIESRFSKVKCTPFRKVNKGDLILFKEASGGIIAISDISDVLYKQFKNGEAEKTLREYQKELTATDDFIELKKDSSYATLMFINETIKINPVKLKKKDRRAWIVFEKTIYGKLF